MPVAISSLAIIEDFLKASKTGVTLGTLSAEFSATGTSLTLNSGFTALEKGPRAIKIDSEVIMVTGTGATLTIIPHGRGFFGTTAAVHASGATVTRATLSDCVTNIAEGDLLDFENAAPAISFTLPSSWDVSLGAMVKPRALFKVYGGKDSQGTARTDAPRYLYDLLIERCDDVEKGFESVGSGTVVTADYLDEEGQSLLGETGSGLKPPWPYILTFVNFELRKD